MPYPYNPANVPASSYTPIPEGEYDVIIEHAEEQRSKASGKEMMKLSVSILYGNHAGRKLWDYIVYDDNAARKFRDILRSCGLPDLMQDITQELFEGAAGRVKVKHELYQGERKAKLHYWIEAESGDAAEDDPDMPPTPTASDEPPIDEADLPF